MRATISVLVLIAFCAGYFIDPVYTLPFDHQFGLPRETLLAIFGLLAAYCFLEVVTLGARIAGASKTLDQIQEETDKLKTLSKESRERLEEQVRTLEAEKELLRTQALDSAKTAGSDVNAKSQSKPSEQEPTPAVKLFLAKLQEEGRFLDFVMDDIGGVSDEQIGAAARVVHQGCKRALSSMAEIEPLHSNEEGSTVNLDSSYDASEWRLIGKVTDSPPFSGTLVHRGWKLKRLETGEFLDEQVRNSPVLYPAELEIQ